MVQHMSLQLGALVTMLALSVFVVAEAATNQRPNPDLNPNPNPDPNPDPNPNPNANPTLTLTLTLALTRWAPTSAAACRQSRT